MIIFSEVAEKNALNTTTPHSTAKIQIVQDWAPTSGVAEFLKQWLHLK